MFYSCHYSCHQHQFCFLAHPENQLIKLGRLTYSIIKFQSISLLFWSCCVDKTQKKPGTKPIYPMDTFSIPSTTGTQGSKYSVFIWMFVVLCLNVQIVYISQIIYVDISCTNKKIMMFNPGKIVE